VKAVLDTNVLVAAFVSDGLCRRLLLRARNRSFTLAISPFIRNEFARVLRRKAGAAVLRLLALVDGGEAEAIVLTRESAGSFLLIDDRRARDVARRRNLARLRSWRCGVRSTGCWAASEDIMTVAH